MTPTQPGPRRRSQRRAFQADVRDRARMTFAEHTAVMIVSVAAAASQGDPQAIAEHALAMALDIDVEGLDELAGPDYPPELETADEAAAELAEIEEN